MMKMEMAQLAHRMPQLAPHHWCTWTQLSRPYFALVDEVN
jgi:hypothetical protein